MAMSIVFGIEERRRREPHLLAHQDVVQRRVEAPETARTCRVAGGIEQRARADDVRRLFRLRTGGIDRPSGRAQHEIRESWRPLESNASVIRIEETPLEIPIWLEARTPAMQEIVSGRSCAGFQSGGRAIRLRIEQAAVLEQSA